MNETAVCLFATEEKVIVRKKNTTSATLQACYNCVLQLNNICVIQTYVVC